MDFRLMLVTFGAVFAAELGDKTQLAALSLSASSASRWSVFIGASAALVASTALAVFLGHALGERLPMVWIRRVSGALFILIGLFVLLSPGSPS